MIELKIIPVVTEKSTLASQNGKHTFKVPANTNKVQIKQQLEKMYGKKVESVNIVNSRPKTRNLGRRTMVKRAPFKKAIVTFQGKESIDLNKIK
ncbi:MAG: 50S ribosomal protein L23 [Magnetovibrio sp.]|nr:50S ribosomal protein L23 [Magnetovibrio sp.]